MPPSQRCPLARPSPAGLRRAARAHAAAARRPAAEALALRRRSTATDLMLCAGARADRRRCPRRGGRCGTGTRRCASARVFRPRRRSTLGDARRCAAAPRRPRAGARRRRRSRSTSPPRRAYIWTRKQPRPRARARSTAAPVDAARPRRRLRRLPRAPHGLALVRRRRRGAATARAVAWNLVDGVHDAPAGSERTVWVDGAPREVAARDVRARTSARSRRRRLEVLRFAARGAPRARATTSAPALATTSSRSARSPGALPGGSRSREGWGVMERHDVRW